MSDLCPYTPAVLTRLAADAKGCVERGDPGALVLLCSELLPWSSRQEINRTLGTVLRLLFRHGDAEMIAKIEADAFSLERLVTGWNPENASAAYLNWKYCQAFQPGRDPDLAHAQGLTVAAQALWPHLDEPTRIAYGLYLKLATAHGALGHVQPLRALGEDLLAGPLDHARQEAALLRIIKQFQRLRAFPELQSLLEQLLRRSGHNEAWEEPVLAAVEALRVSAQRLADYERLGHLLSSVAMWLEHYSRALCDGRLVKALLCCAAFDQLHLLIPHLVAKIDAANVRSLLLSILDQLFRYDVLGDASQYIERTYRLDPGDPLAALLFARYLTAQGLPDSEIEPLFGFLQREAPRYDEAVFWRAQQYYGSFQYTRLVDWLEAHPLNNPEKAVSLLSRVRAALDRPPFPSAVSQADSERLSLQNTGSLRPLLEPIAQFMNGDLSATAEPPLAEVTSRLRNVVLAIARITESPSQVIFADCLNTVAELRRVAGTLVFLAAGGYRYDPSGQGRRPVQLPHYGGPDCTRIRVIFEVLHRVSMQLSQHAIEAILQGATLTDVRHLCVLADMHVQSACQLGEVEKSEELLHKLRERRVALPYVLGLLEHCAFQRADLDAAEKCVAGQMVQGGDVHRLESFKTWVETESTQVQVLVQQDPWKGTFEYINPLGTLQRVVHEVPGTCLWLGRVPGLKIRGIELLIGPKGTMLRPNPEHRRDVFGYPPKSFLRLNYGHGGCRLRPAKERVRVQEPVVVLANMDGPFWQNYYHWMVTILTRVAVMLDCDELAHCRLLVPTELATWMRTSLELVGVPQERLLFYSTEQEVVAEDAWLIGSVEWASAALFKPLQRRLWLAAGVDPQASATRAVWLSRRHEHQRYLANSDAVESLARSLGFEIIDPGTLSLLEQVRLCAGAKILAGPEGSNFTNLMFARPGTRVLTLMLAGGDYETWLDMCVMGDLTQRWIFGRADPRKSWWAFHHEPYEVDLTVVERELRRLLAEAT